MSALMVKYTIMKNWKLFISVILFAGILFFSCASNSKLNKSNTTQIAENQNEEEIIEPLPEEIFIEEMNKYSLSFIKAPAKTTKGKKFSTPFEVTVLDENGNPAADFDVCFVYPYNKDGTQIKCTTTVITTDENGVAVFDSGIVDFSVNDQIYAYPNVTVEFTKYYDLFPIKMAWTDFIVESDIAAKGAILFVFEYNENGKSPENSYDILSGLRKKGVTMIGNAPISDTSYINASKEIIYKENYESVGSNFGYLIGGTIKFANPVQKNEDGTYTATLIADIYGIEMKTGNVIYEDTNEYTGTGTNWNKAVSDAKQGLTSLAVDSIMYGL